MRNGLAAPIQVTLAGMPAHEFQTEPGTAHGAMLVPLHAAAQMLVADGASVAV